MADFKNVWCVADVRKNHIFPSLYELLFLGRRLADASGEKLCVVLIGHSLADQPKPLGAYGVDRVYVLDHPLFEHFVDESHSRALVELLRKEKPGKVLFPTSSLGHAMASRSAAMLGAPLASDVIAAAQEGENLKVTRSCCGASLRVTLESRSARPEMLVLRAGAFSPAPSKNGVSVEVVAVPIDPKDWKLRSRYKGSEKSQEGEKDITQAEVIVSGGYGLGKPEGFELIRQLAKMLGGGVGASRRAVDLGWIPYRHQVGLTGRTVNPKLYIACGISGQVQHLAGMSGARVIVAINKDPEAPLMKLANFSVETDLFEFLPALIEEIKKAKHIS